MRSEKKKSIKELNLSSFNVSKVTSMAGMFGECLRLTRIYVNPVIWDASGVSNSARMFENTNLPGYDPAKIDAKMAVIQEKGGYLTAIVPDPVSIIKAEVSGIKDKRYTGSAITQAPAVKLDVKELKFGTDYTVSYTNNTNVGTANVIITGKGSYTGTIKRTFQIKQAANPLAVKPRTVTVKYGKLRKKTQTLPVTKIFKKRSGQDEVSAPVREKRKKELQEIFQSKRWKRKADTKERTKERNLSHHSESQSGRK